MTGDSRDDKFEALLREIARTDDIPMPTATLDMVGRTLGRFRVLSLLGKGGMGVVYLAEDTTLHREVALKVLSRDAASDPERRRRLVQEARAAAAVSHPNIATIYEVGEADGLLYIAMERLRGESLRAKIAKQGMAIDNVIVIVRQILDGLAKAHDAGIVHRDLKPDNVMVDEKSRVKLLDFGLAKFWRKSPDQNDTVFMPTEEGRLLGTPSYMSPEQASGLPLDARSDVFSFGVVLYEMLTGELPFQGANFLKIMAAIERDEPAPAASKNPNVSPEIEQILTTCLRKDPAERFTHAREILEQFEQLEPIPSMPHSLRGSLIQSTPTPSAPSPNVPLLNTQTTLTTRRHLLPWAIVGVLLLVLLTIVFSNRIQPNLVQANLRSFSTPHDSATPSANVAETPTVITDLALPSAANSAVIAAYKRSVSKYRLGDGAPETDLLQAIDLDPTFAAGYLRLATYWVDQQGRMGRRREYFQKALENASNLTERDRAVLEASDPLFRTQPVNLPEYVRRMSALVDRWPNDAELWFLRAVGHRRSDNIDAMEADLRQALVLDPKFGTAHALLAHVYLARGAVKEARAQYETCLKELPTAAVCMRGLALYVAMASGECSEVDVLARKMSSVSPDWFEAYLFLASVLARHPNSIPAAEESMVQWESAFEAQHDAKQRAAMFYEAQKLENRASLDIVVGDFISAEKKLRDAMQIRSPSFMLIDRSSAMVSLADLLHEMGRIDEAAKLADDYLNRSTAWEPPGKGIDFSRPVMLELARKGHLISQPKYIEQRNAWLQHAESKTHSAITGHNALWFLAYANGAHDAASAHEALTQLPAYAPLNWAATGLGDVVAAGRAFLLGGDKENATIWLERATHHCGVLTDPIASTHAHLLLGQLHEQKGDVKGACASYQGVLERWGHAKPKSISADTARARHKTLACPTTSP